MQPLWSILLCSLSTRYPDPASTLLAELNRQIAGRPIELICLVDNFYRSIGDKRNKLLALAQGEYLSFMDDDDFITPNYATCVLDALKRKPDVVTWKQETRYVNTNLTYICEYSLNHEYLSKKTSPTTGRWYGKPAHTNVWRSEIAKTCVFPEKDFGEDVDWVSQACSKAFSEIIIPEILTIYNYDPTKNETRDDGWRMDYVRKLGGPNEV